MSWRGSAAALSMLLMLSACSGEGPTTADAPASSPTFQLGEDGEPLYPSEEPSVLPDVTISPPKFAGKDKDEPADGSAAAPEEIGEVPELKSQSGGGKRFARGEVSVNEPRPDAETSGVSERYAEATRVTVAGLGDSLLVRMVFEAELPPEMPNKNTYMVVGFGLSGRKEGDHHSFGARASNDGWVPYADKKGESTDFPGTFFIEGSTMEITVPWDVIGGPRPFEWYASSSWFSYVAGVSSYSFDLIPESAGRYPNG
jgi:hypothetical protein